MSLQKKMIWFFILKLSFFFNLLGRLLFSDIRFLVFDEADTMMDDNFRKVNTEILAHCQVFI